MGLLLLLSHRLPDWPTSYFWPARQPWKSEWRFETRDNSTHFSKLFLIMVVSISKSPSAHNNLMFFLKRSADLQRLLGIAFKSQKIKLEDKTAENWWRPGAQKDRSTPVVGQSCSVPPRTRLLVQPWVIQVWLIWIRLRCSRYSRYSRRYGRNGSTYRSKYTINLFKNTTFISKRCVFQRWFLSIRSWLSKPKRSCVEFLSSCLTEKTWGTGQHGRKNGPALGNNIHKIIGSQMNKYNRKT